MQLIHVSPHEDNMPITGGLTDLGDTRSLTKKDKWFLFSLSNVILNIQPIDESLEDRNYRIYLECNIYTQEGFKKYWELIGRKYQEYGRERAQDASDTLSRGIEREFGFYPTFKFERGEIEKAAEKIMEK
jgi:hypothetical protein